MNQTFRTLLGTCVLGTALVGCGSSDNNDPVYYYPTSGNYAGGMSGADGSNAFRMVVLDSQEYWIFYGADVAGRNFVMNGAVAGTDIRPYTGYTYTGGWNYGSPWPGAVNVNSAYQPSTGGVNGYVTTSSSAVFSYSGTAYRPSTPYGVQGTWSLRALDNRVVNLDLAVNGNFSATDSFNCVFSGSMSQSSVTGVYRVILDDPNRCFGSNIRFSGIALVNTSSANQQEIMLSVINGGNGVGLYGAR